MVRWLVSQQEMYPSTSIFCMCVRSLKLYAHICKLIFCILALKRAVTSKQFKHIRIHMCTYVHVYLCVVALLAQRQLFLFHCVTLLLIKARLTFRRSRRLILARSMRVCMYKYLSSVYVCVQVQGQLKAKALIELIFTQLQ